MTRYPLYPSCHVYELFKPLETCEHMMVDVLDRIAELDFYRAIETGFYLEADHQRRVRETCKQNGWQLTMWTTPTILAEGLNLSSLDPALREKSVARTIELVQHAIACGADKIGVPSGDYPGDAHCEEAKKVLYDSFVRISESIAAHPNMQIVLEPLDRYAHKKQLIGPMAESIEWFAPLHQECSNIFIHWDSAHEALGKIDLLESLRLARPYLSQLHLTNAILDPSHPMYGDWHMDVGQAPAFASPGYLTPEIGAEILREVVSEPLTPGCKATFVAMEIRSHIGDDLWHKEETGRTFLKRCLELADLS